MTASRLTRYLDPDFLSRVAAQPIEPAGSVIGNLGVPTNPRSVDSRSNSLAIATTSSATTHVISIGGCITSEIGFRSSSMTWRQISSVICCWM